MTRRKAKPTASPSLGSKPIASKGRAWLIAVLLAGLTAIVGLQQLNPVPTGKPAVTAYSDAPGLTVDEVFNVQEGVRLAIGLKAWIYGAVSWQEVFGTQKQPGQPSILGEHLPDHPPLGRLWLGVWHNIALSWNPLMPEEQSTNGPRLIVTSRARVGSVMAFALTVGLVGYAGSRWFGSVGGVVSGLSLVLMPRVFGHAHLASLETVTNLAWTAAVLSILFLWQKPAGLRFRPVAITGIFFGILLATKIQAVLLPIPVAVWALYQFRLKAIRPLVIWTVTGFLVFFVCWPWLWFEPLPHLKEYFARTTERATLYVWYWGERYADKQVPWHYPFVMSAITIPVGLQLLGLAGIFGGGKTASESRGPAWSDRTTQLLLLAGVFPLVLFALPGIAVYDGVRLFLVAFPLWALMIGRGAGWLTAVVRRRYSSAVAGSVLTIFLSAQAVGAVMLSPAWLSYHNLLIGGLPGATAVGMERDYWGGSVTPNLWQQTVQAVPRGSRIYVVPVLHPLQLPDVSTQLPLLQRHGIELVAGAPAPGARAWCLVFYRIADLPSELQERLRTASPAVWMDDKTQHAVECRRQGIVVAGLYLLK